MRTHILSLCLLLASACQGGAPAALAPPAVAESKQAVTGAGDEHPHELSPPQAPRGPASWLQPVPRAAAASLTAPAAGISTFGCSGNFRPRHLKVLLITGTPSEPGYLAMSSFLRQIGVPFDTLVASTTPLSAGMLESGGVGAYQGIILSTGNLVYESPGEGFISAFTQAEWSTLWSYEARYCVRQVNFYTSPVGGPEDYGLTLVGTQDTSAAPLTATLTAAGRQVFSYLQGSAAVPIQLAWVYLATANSSSVTPLLSGGGAALVSVKDHPDGRESLTSTFDQNPELVHSQLLNYGIINWVTRGVYLGQRRYYASAQVDDIFLPNVLWDPTLNASNPDVTYRMSVADLDRSLQWQSGLRAAFPLAGDLVYDMTFNGQGTVRFGANDPLTLRARALQGSFRWLNHTYTHTLLDTADYALSSQEISNNNQVAQALGLSRYSSQALVTGGHTGFDNAEFARAAVDRGVRYAASNSSMAGQDNPSPGTGIVSRFQSALYWVPRRPTNIFFNVTTPEELASEYNFIYRSFWGRDLSYSEILDKEVDVAMNSILKYSANPFFFHQTNLRMYSGNRQLLADFLERLFARYQGWLTPPLRSLSHRDTALLMQRRAAYDQSGADAIWIPSLRQVTVWVQRSADVPVTGAAFSGESYGSQRTDYVSVTPRFPRIVIVN